MLVNESSNSITRTYIRDGAMIYMSQIPYVLQRAPFYTVGQRRDMAFKPFSLTIEAIVAFQELARYLYMVDDFYVHWISEKLQSEVILNEYVNDEKKNVREVFCRGVTEEELVLEHNRIQQRYLDMDADIKHLTHGYDYAWISAMRIRNYQHLLMNDKPALLKICNQILYAEQGAEPYQFMNDIIPWLWVGVETITLDDLLDPRVYGPVSPVRSIQFFTSKLAQILSGRITIPLLSAI